MKAHRREELALASVDQFLRLLRRFDTATLINHESDGDLHGRPVALADVDPDGTLWFRTNDASRELSELADGAPLMVTLEGDAVFVVANGRLRAAGEGERERGDAEADRLRFFMEDAEVWDNSGARGIKFAYRAPTSPLSDTSLGSFDEIEGQVESSVVRTHA